jgi:NAD+ diphosphatase
MDAPQTFTGSPLDRAASKRRDPSWLAARLADPSSRFLAFRELRPLVAGAGEELRLAWLRAEELAPLVAENLARAGAEAPASNALDRETASGDEPLLLGLEPGGAARFAMRVPGGDGADDPALGAGVGPARFADARGSAMRLPPEETAILAQARSLLAWHAAHPRCARCGGRTTSREGGYARRCAEEGCGASHFPRSDPVVIMLVHRGDRALLGRSVRDPPFPPGLFSCLAGYVEPGESVEEAVRRELEEESGVRVGAVRYHASQPWPFPSQLMIGCLAEAASDEIRIDPTEVEEARWFTRDEVRAGLARWRAAEGFRLPPPITAAHVLATAWVGGATAAAPPRGGRENP